MRHWVWWRHHGTDRRCDSIGHGVEVVTVKSIGGAGGGGGQPATPGAMGNVVEELFDVAHILGV